MIDWRIASGKARFPESIHRGFSTSVGRPPFRKDILDAEEIIACRAAHGKFLVRHTKNQSRKEYIQSARK